MTGASRNLCFICCRRGRGEDDSQFAWSGMELRILGQHYRTMMPAGIVYTSFRSQAAGLGACCSNLSSKPGHLAERCQNPIACNKVLTTCRNAASRQLCMCKANAVHQSPPNGSCALVINRYKRPGAPCSRMLTRPVAHPLALEGRIGTCQHISSLATRMRANNAHGKKTLSMCACV